MLETLAGAKTMDVVSCSNFNINSSRGLATASERTSKSIPVHTLRTVYGLPFTLDVFLVDSFKVRLGQRSLSVHRVKE